jgi:oxygen-independent coproporphyrinogen-3 oxidase
LGTTPQFPLTIQGSGKIVRSHPMKHFRHIYVHVPFCEVICHYCHFYTARSKEARQPEFFSALEKHAASVRSKMADQLDAIYFGGGTPAASPPELIASFLESLKHRITPSTEITIEANPANVTRENAGLWRQAGINRVSMGVQSLNDELLKKLGRVHSADDARNALDTCLSEITNVSCDLMYAVPGQAENEPGDQALELVKQGATHLSAYHLTLEKEHFLHSQLPPDEHAWNQIRGIADRVVPRGMGHYEIASFAAPEYESRNNKNYWSGGPYLAFGPSAHGFDGASTRWSNVSDWQEYVRRVNAGESPAAWTETLTPSQRLIEVVFTRIRTSEGLDLEAFRQQFGIDLVSQKKALFERWQKEGLGTVTNGHFVLSFPGRMLADEIAKKLI